MSRQVSGISVCEAILEILIIPLLFIMPFAVVRELTMFFQAPGMEQKLGVYITAITVIMFGIIFLPFILKDFLAKGKGVFVPVALFFVQSFGFSLVFWFLNTNRPYDYAIRSSSPELVGRFMFFVALIYVVVAAVSIMIAAIPMAEARDERRPLSRITMMFVVQSLAFSLYYVIFRSMESFRLPQQAMMQVSVAFIMVLFVLSSALKGRIELRKTILNKPIFLITAISIVSFALTPNFYVSMKEFTQYFFVIASFYMLIHMLDAKKYISALSAVIIAIIAIEAIVGIGQLFGLNDKIHLASNFDPFATLGNKNYVAELLAMGIPFALGIAVAAHKIWQKVLVWISLDMMLIVVLAAVTRGSWIGLISSTIFFLLFAIDRLPKKKALEAVSYVGLLIASSFVFAFMSSRSILFRPPDVSYSSRFMSIINILGDLASKKPVFWAGYLLVFLIFSGGLWIILQRQKARYASILFLALVMLVAGGMIGLRQNTTQTQHVKSTLDITQTDLTPPSRVEDSITSRRFIWGGTFEMIKHYPLGVGLGAFKVRYLNMLKAYLEKTDISGIPGFFKDVNAKEAHSEYLHIWAEMGPLVLLFFAYFAINVFVMFKRVYYNSPNPMVQATALGAFSALISIATSATLGFPFHIIGTSLLAGAILAVLFLCRDLTYGTGTLDVAIKGFSGAPEPVSEQQNQDNAKGGKKKKQKNQPPLEQLSPEQLAAEENWKKHWFVGNFPVYLSIPLIIIVLTFFGVVSMASYNWERSNIDMKTANFLAKANRDAESNQFYQMALKADPYNGDIHLFLGMFYQKRKEMAKALEEFEIARTYYDLPQLSLDIGAVYFEMGEQYYDLAEKAFIESLGVYPNYPLPRYNLGLIYYQRGISLMSMNPQQLAEKGLTPALAKASAEENFNKSADMFLASVQIDPRLDTASFKLALTYEKLFDIDPTKYSVDDPIKWYFHTLRINGRHADASYNLGLMITRKASVINSQADAYLRQGDRDRAMSLYASASQVMADSGQYFDRAIALNPRHFKALNNRGNQLFNEGKTKQAMELYKRALEVEPNYQNAKLNYALALVNLNMCEEAMPYLDQLLKESMQPRHEMKVVYMKGSCLAVAGDLQQAAAIMDAEIKKMESTRDRVSVEYASVATKNTQVLDMLGRYPEALSMIERVATYELPVYQASEVMFRYGLALSKNNRKDEANAVFGKLVERYPNSPFAKQLSGIQK